MDVVELAPGLWRWTTAHPDWTPDQGGPEGWERDVGSVYCETGESVLLIDPLVPAEGNERDRFFTALDRDLDRAGPPQVVLTCAWHARSADELVDRYSARRWEPGAALDLPAGVEAVAAALEGEVLLWLAAHAALIAGDSLLGDGGLHMCPDSWLGDRDPAEVRAALRAGLQLWSPRFVLPSHGDPVTDGAAAALERALAA